MWGTGWLSLWRVSSEAGACCRALEVIAALQVGMRCCLTVWFAAHFVALTLLSVLLHTKILHVFLGRFVHLGRIASPPLWTKWRLLAGRHANDQRCTADGLSRCYFCVAMNYFFVFGLVPCARAVMSRRSLSAASSSRLDQLSASLATK